MELTKAERAILVNQFEILKLLDPDGAGHYDESIEILSSGFKVFYEDALPWACDDVEESVTSFLFSVLDLFRALEGFYREHPDTPALKRYGARFRGFDGNDETDYYVFAKFLLEVQDKYGEQKDNPDFEVNSHSPTLDSYGEMVATWERLGKPWKLTEAQVLEIVPE